MTIKKLTSAFLGVLLLGSVSSGLRPIQAQSRSEDGSELETWRDIPRNWPERVKKSPYLKNDPNYGIFICLADSNPLWVKQFETDPMIPAELKTKYTCPKGTVLIRTVKPLRFPTGMNNFACVVAPNPEDLVPRKPSSPIDARTGLPINSSPDKLICPNLTVGVDIMVDIDYNAINKLKGSGPSPSANESNENGPKIRRNLVRNRRARPNPIFQRLRNQGRLSSRPAVRPNRRLGRAGGGAYFYNSFQIVSSTGAYKGMSVNISQVQPEYAQADKSIGGHSITQMAMSTRNLASRVEMGWQVAPNLYGDNRPRLFVYQRINSTTGYYNRTSGSTFVSVDPVYVPGSYLVDINSVDFVYSFYIEHNDSLKRWDLYYRNVLIGYYPDSSWNNSFTRGDYPAWYGEVYGNSANTCTDMGNGLYGYSSGSALMREPVVINANGTTTALSSANILFSPLNANGSLYKFGTLVSVGGKNQIRFGGLGTGKCPP